MQDSNIPNRLIDIDIYTANRHLVIDVLDVQCIYETCEYNWIYIYICRYYYNIIQVLFIHIHEWYVLFTSKINVNHVFPEAGDWKCPACGDHQPETKGSIWIHLAWKSHIFGGKTHRRNQMKIPLSISVRSCLFSPFLNSFSVPSFRLTWRDPSGLSVT